MKNWCTGNCGDRAFEFSFGHSALGIYPVDVTVIYMVPVIAVFVEYEKKNQNACSKTYRQSQDIDQGISLLAPYTAEGNFDKILKSFSTKGKENILVSIMSDS